MNAGPGERLSSMWERCRGLPGGRALFSRALAWMVPYSGTIRPTVLELGPGLARVEMKDRRRVRNHLRSVHAVALLNLAELATGLALNVGLSDDARSILTGIRIEYVKKARGTITAHCECALPGGSEEKEHEIEGTLTDAHGDVVARASALWLVGPRRS